MNKQNEQQAIPIGKGNLLLFVPFLAVSLYKTMDKIMLGAMTTNVQVGLYESAEKIIRIPVALISSLGSVMMPRISVLMAEGKKEEYSKYTELSFYFACFIATSISFGIMGISKEFVPLFYGQGFEKCIDLYYLLLPSCLFLAISNVLLTQYIIPSNYYAIQITAVSGAAAVNLLMNGLLIPKLQANGAAIGTLLAEMTVMIIEMVSVRKQTHIIKSIKSCVPMAISGIIMFILLYFIHIPMFSPLANIGVKVMIGMFVYIGTLLLQILVMKRMGNKRLAIAADELYGRVARIIRKHKR